MAGCPLPALGLGVAGALRAPRAADAEARSDARADARRPARRRPRRPGAREGRREPGGGREPPSGREATEAATDRKRMWPPAPPSAPHPPALRHFLSAARPGPSSPSFCRASRRKVDPHARLHDRTRTASSPTPAVPAPCPGVHAPAARAPLLRAGENALAGQVRRSLLSGPRPTPHHSRTTRARCAPRGIPRAPGRPAGKRRCGPGFRSEAHPEAQENPAPPGKGERGQVTHRHKAAP